MKKSLPCEKRSPVQLLELHNLVFPVRGDEKSAPVTLLLPDHHVIWVKGRAGDLLAGLLLPEDILPRDALAVGEASRVALVRGLMTEPQVLLLDEPTAASALGSMMLVGLSYRRLFTEDGAVRREIFESIDSHGGAS